jgi:hypothetical protein
MKTKDIVKELISKYVKAKPNRISLKLDWEYNRSIISIQSKSLKESIEYKQTIDFTSFAHGVVEAFRDEYGELQVVPISFREELYKNEKVALDLYPTGSAGIFDIFVEYRQKKKDE